MKTHDVWSPFYIAAGNILIEFAAANEEDNNASASILRGKDAAHATREKGAEKANFALWRKEYRALGFEPWATEPDFAC
jgi:hypothetical protein